MTKYRVLMAYTRKEEYIIDAESKEMALEKVQAGECDKPVNTESLSFEEIDTMEVK